MKRRRPMGKRRTKAEKWVASDAMRIFEFLVFASSGTCW